MTEWPGEGLGAERSRQEGRRERPWGKALGALQERAGGHCAWCAASQGDSHGSRMDPQPWEAGGLSDVCGGKTPGGGLYRGVVGSICL